MRIWILVALALLAGGLALLSVNQRGVPSTSGPVVTPTEGERENDRAAAHPSAQTMEAGKTPSQGSSEVTETIESLAAEGRLDALDNLFERAGSLTATERAALISAALSVDDSQLLGRAESLTIAMLSEGSEADVLAVLPLASQFAPTSYVFAISQESLCRFRGFAFEVLKLKFDRTIPNGRPWSGVCKTSWE